MTPAEIKSKFIATVSADIAAQQASQPVRFRKPEWRISQIAEEHLNRAMARAVAAGRKLPKTPVTTPVAFSDCVRFYTNFGGVLIEDKANDGIPVSESAAEFGRDYVSVMYDGRVCVMTVEEAFDRGLSEYSDFELETDDERALAHIVGNIVDVASQGIAGITPSSLRELRLSADLTQTEAAALINMSLSGYQKLEGGQRTSGLRSAFELLRYKINDPAFNIDTM